MALKGGQHTGRRLNITAGREWPNLDEPEWIAGKVLRWVPKRNKQPVHYVVRTADGVKTFPQEDWFEKYFGRW